MEESIAPNARENVASLDSLVCPEDLGVVRMRDALLSHPSFAGV
jgi:hypothetical protein